MYWSRYLRRNNNFARQCNIGVYLYTGRPKEGRRSRLTLQAVCRKSELEENWRAAAQRGRAATSCCTRGAVCCVIENRHRHRAPRVSYYVQRFIIYSTTERTAQNDCCTSRIISFSWIVLVFILFFLQLFM